MKEQTGGVPFEDFKNDMKNQMLRERVIRQEVGEHIIIKHEELEKYYNEHKADFVREENFRLREILISTEGKDEAGIAAAEKKAEDLVARARKGERFPELARDNSDAITAKSMGLLDPYKKGVLDPTLETQVWDKPKGYVTDPIPIKAGFEILRVEDHQKAGQAELADVEGEVQDKLYAPRMQPLVRDYLTKLRKEAFIEIKPEYVDSGRRAGKDTSWVDPAQLKPETVTKAQVALHARKKRLLWMVPVPGTPLRVPPARRNNQFMKSPFVSDLKPNQVITTTFLVHGKDVRQKKSGEPYLSLLLGDRTGDDRRQNVGQRRRSDGDFRARRLRQSQRAAASFPEPAAAHHS